MKDYLTRCVPSVAFLGFTAWALSAGHTGYAMAAMAVAILTLP